MTLILDWDGTVTVDDTLIVALREFGDWQVYLDAAAALRRGEITLHEEIRRDAESIKAPISEVVDWLVENLELRPGFHELAEAHRPTIVSSNFRDRKSTRLNSSHANISYAVFCLKKKKSTHIN